MFLQRKYMTSRIEKVEMLEKLLSKNKEEESRGESQLHSTHEPSTPIQYIRTAMAATNPRAKHQQGSHHQITEKQSSATFSSSWEAGPWHWQTCLPRGFGTWLYLHEFSAEQELCDHRSGRTGGAVPAGSRALSTCAELRAAERTDASSNLHTQTDVHNYTDYLITAL